MRYYGMIGTPFQVVDESDEPKCPDGYITMLGERPTPFHVADASGVWILLKDNEDEESGE